MEVETIKNFNFVFQCVSHFCLFYSLSYKNKVRELFLFSRLHSKLYLLKSGKVNKCKLDFNYKIKKYRFLWNNYDLRNYSRYYGYHVCYYSLPFGSVISYPIRYRLFQMQTLWTFDASQIPTSWGVISSIRGRNNPFLWVASALDSPIHYLCFFFWNITICLSKNGKVSGQKLREVPLPCTKTFITNDSEVFSKK